MHDRGALETMPTHISTTQQTDKQTQIDQADTCTSDLYEGIAPSYHIPRGTPVKYFTDRSKAVLLAWIFYVFVLSYVCYVFVRVCLYVLCGHLLGKGLTSWLSFVVSNYSL